tara:strand:+ start:354 stop:551 length:198 start_codon:yes stop_codon:yes gene_type:complete
MDTDATLWLETLINDLYGEASYRRDGIEGYWDGYSSPFLASTRTDKDVRDDIRRRERMAEAIYDV